MQSTTYNVLDETRINLATTLVQKVRSRTWNDFKQGTAQFALHFNNLFNTQRPSKKNDSF